MNLYVSVCAGNAVSAPSKGKTHPVCLYIDSRQLHYHTLASRTYTLTINDLVYSFTHALKEAHIKKAKGIHICALCIHTLPTAIVRV